MSAHRRGLTLRATLIALALGVSLYIAAISGIIAYEIAPGATAIRQQSAKLHAEFEASSERAAALKSAIAEIRNLMARLVASKEVESIRAKIQSHVDSAGAAQNIGAMPGIPGEMRISLGRAADAESQLAVLLIEALADVEINRHAEAETKLVQCDFLQTLIAGHLNEAQRFGLLDLIRREKSLGEAADGAIKMVGWWAAIGAALIPAFALFVQHRFYRPLAELDRGLARVAEGDIETTVEIHREDELGRLSRHFNRMTDVLRQRAEEERRRAHSVTERFGRILDQSSNEIYIFDAETYHFLQVNRGARENLGYTGEEFSGLTPLDLMPEFDRASFDELAALMRAGQREMAMITTIHRRKDGTTYPVEVNIQISRRETPTVMVSIVRDITERKQMEEALRESEEQFRLAIDAAQMGTWDWNLVTNHIRRTGRAYQLFGVTQELLGDTSSTFLDRIHPQDRQHVRQAIRRAIDDGTLYSEEFRVMLPDGSVRWRAAQGTTFRDDEGRAARMVGVVLDITERKRMEEALRDSETMFRTLTETITMAIYIYRGDRYLYVNSAAEKITGYGRDELMKMDLLALAYAEDRDRIIDYVRRRQRGEEVPTRYETRFLTKTRAVRWIDVTIAQIDYKGEPAYLATAFDITERKQAEAALRESEERFSKAFQASPLAMSISAMGDGCIIAANESFLRLCDYTRQEIIGHTAEELRLWIDPDERKEFIRRAIEQGEVRDMEAAVRTRGGENLVVLLSGVLIELGGEPCVLFTAIDITERKRAERALRESESRFRALIENSLDVIIMFDADGKVLYTSPSVTRVLGYDPDELVGQVGIGQVHPDEREKSTDVFAEALQKKRSVVKLVNRILHKDGSYRTVQVIGTNLLDEPGVNAMVSNLRDITEQVRAEEEVLRLNEELEHRVAERTAQLEAVNRELEAFSYSVSHDLRAPLRSIDGFSLALMEDCADELGETGLDYLARVRAASQRMGQLIDDLLNLSRITRSDMHRERVDLSALAHSIAMEFQSADQAREVEFWIAPDLMAEADPRLLHVALENLLGNSWKFTEKTRRAIIEFGSARDGDETLFFVRDNGAGFDMAYADKLFGAFQRLHPMTEFKGTGIGLATVQRIINRHGGRIWAEGRIGEGSTFYFTLS